MAGVIIRQSSAKVTIRVTGQGVPGPAGATAPHAPTHSRTGLGGTDSITVENLATSGASGSVPTSDGAGGLTMATPAGGGNVISPGGETANRLAFFTGSNAIDDTTIDPAVVEVTTNKNSANGYAGLDGSTKLTGAQQVYGTTTNTAIEGNDSRVPTQGENDALLGTDGTPSTSNRYVTNTDPRNTDSRAPNGTATGDLAGTYPAPTVDGLQTTPVSAVAPTEGQVLTSLSGVWTPAAAAGGVTDHGALTGLADDDHMQYLLVDGTRAMTGDFDMGDNDVVSFITDVGTGSSSSLGSFITEALSAGRITGGLITEATSTTVDVALGKGAIRSTNDATDELRSIGWADSLGTTIPIDTVLFFGVEWNAGSPQIINKGTDTWNYQTEFPLGSATRDSTGIHITSTPQQVGDAPGETNRRFYETLVIARDNRQGGLVLGETGTRNMTLSAGALWSRLNRFSIGAIDTSVSGSVDFYFRDGSGGFNVTASQTQWPNTQFDDGSGTLVTMTNGRFAVLWFYVGFDGDLVAQYGRNEYNQIADAEDEAPPSSAPLRISEHATLAGRFIFQESSATTESISSVFDILFSSSSVTDHGELSGLGDDDHTQYQLRSEKNNPSGYAGLDGGTKLTGTQQLYGTIADTACEGDDSRLSDSRIPTGTATGDLAGTYPAPTVDGLQTTPVSAVAPAEGQVLTSLSGTWTAASPVTGVTDHGALTGLLDDDHTQYQLRSEKNAASGYPGLDGSSKITGSQQTYGTIADTACVGNDARLSDSRAPNGTATGDLSGTYPAPTVDGLQTTPVSAVAPTEGQVLTSLSGTWTAATPVTGVTDHGALTGLLDDDHTQYQLRTEKDAASGYVGLTAGSKISNGAFQVYGTIANTACVGNDARLSDSRFPTGTAGGDLGGTYPNPIVDAITTTTGPTSLAIGAIADGSIPQRTGSTLVGGLIAADVFLRTGTVAATGDFDLGTNAIINVGLVDGRDVSADGVVLDAHVGNTSTTAPHTNPMIALRTGARNGGLTTIPTTTTFSISDGDGFIVDNATTPGVPVVTSVSWTGLTSITITALATNDFTAVYINSAGSAVQLTATSPQDRRNKIFVGIIAHNGGTATNVEQVSDVIFEQDQAFRDFMGVIGLTNADGNDYSRATIAALGLDVTSGNLFFPGMNLNDTAANRRNPNFKSQTAATDISWTYIRGDGAGGITVDSTGVTDINVTQFDDGAGGLSTMTGNNYKVDLIYRHSDGGTVVQFGSIQFSSLADAVNSAITTAAPLLDVDFILRFALAVRRNTTDLNTAADAQFIEVIGVGGSASGGGGGGDVLGPSGGVVAGEATEFADASGKVIRGTSGLLTANLAVLDGTRLFSSAIVQAAIPEWSIRETGVAADSGNWAVRADGTTFRITAVDDALTGLTDALTITRTGATPSVIEALTNFVASSTAKISQSVDDTTIILTLSNAGTNGADIEVYAGDRNPEGFVTASPGALYVRANGINSAMYQLEAAASANTPWVEFGAGAAPSGVAEIQVGLDSGTAAVVIGGTPTSVAMDFSAVTFDSAVYTFTLNDTDVVVDVTGRYQLLLDGSVQSTAAGDSLVLAEIWNNGSPVTNAQMQVAVDNASVSHNGFTVSRIIDLSAGDSVGPRFTQTAGSGSVSVDPGGLRFSLLFFSGSIAGAVGRKATWGLVTTAPHAIDTDSGTPFKTEGAGSVRELVAVAQLPTDVAGGTFTFEVFHGPDAGPHVSIGSVSITQGNTSGSFTPGAPVAFAADDIFVIDRTAIGAFPGGTAEDKQRITIELHVDID